MRSFPLPSRSSTGTFSHRLISHSTWCSRIGAGHRIGVPKNIVATDFIVEQIEAEAGVRLRLPMDLSLNASDLSNVSRPIACKRCWRCDFQPSGSPPITCLSFPACHAHYPSEPNRGARRLPACSCCLPQIHGGSAFAMDLSRPAQALIALQPAGLLSCLKRLLSRGSDPTSYPVKPLVSYRTNRQLSGWNFPPSVKRAFGAHVDCHRNSDAPPPDKTRHDEASPAAQRGLIFSQNAPAAVTGLARQAATPLRLCTA
jgi:hypothetical protein